MTATNGKIPSVQGLSGLARPMFGPGMLLQHDDLEQLSVYTRELNRLMFRSLFGCGVICGLVVKPSEDCGRVTLTIGAGLALNCTGDPIHVPKDQTLVLDEHCDPNLKSPLWVVLCAKTKRCAPRASMCSSDEDETTSMSTRERDGFEIRVLSERPKCSCQCVPEEEPSPVQVLGDKLTGGARLHDCQCADPTSKCYEDHYQGKCDCHCDECGGGGCDCVVLAQLEKRLIEERVLWDVNHRVRRFIRPVLMRDPLVPPPTRAAEGTEPKEGGETPTPGPRTSEPSDVERPRATAARRPTRS